MNDAGTEPRTVVVFVAHGSRAAAANEAHVAQAERLADVAGLAVRPAFLELAEPSIPDAIDAAVAGGATRVAVLPYFLYPGRHVGRDIPELVETSARRHPEASVVLLGSFGADPAVVDLLAAQLRSATTPG